MHDVSTPADAWPVAAWPELGALRDELATFAASSRWDADAIQRLIGSSGGPRTSSASVRRDDGRIALAMPAIVTGQQPAVGGGPLYTLVKAAHAVALAGALSCERFVATPVFWCASEDHDLGEAGHADLVTRHGTIQRFSSDLGGGRAALRHRPAALWWDGLVAHCRDHLGPGLGAAWLQEQRPLHGEGMGAWLCRLMAALFPGDGVSGPLRCVEGHQLRPLWRTALSRALEGWPAADLERQRQQLLAAGRHDAFGELAQAPLFADRTDGRTALTPAEARALLADDALALSPGAALRPVLQQAALQVPIYVAGPGEIAYHAFIAPLYAALGVPRPRLAARCSLTLVPSWVQRGLERWGCRAEDCEGAAPTTSGSGSVGEFAALDAALDALQSRQAAAPADLGRRLAAGCVRLRRERRRLGDSLARGERQAAQRPAWGALVGHLRPRGQRQERTMSLFQALWEHGPGLARTLVAAARDCAPGEHRYVALG